ncbi:MAG: acyl-CoA thioesterase [bacterium]|nr:acyl-CoA thioesterase [bacterium]
MSSKGKKPSESQLEVAHVVLPSDSNALGTIFGGQVMAWIDLAASVVASRHARKVCVTVSMDELHFIAPSRVGDIVILKGSVNYTHKTSLEIGVRVESENPLTGKRCHTASAYLTFVAVNEKGKPTPITPVVPETALEKKRFKEGEARRRHRLSIWKTKK